MQKQINKKIILYLFIFILLGTLSNKNLLKDSLKKNYNLEIISLSNFDDEEIINMIMIKITVIMVTIMTMLIRRPNSGRKSAG